MAVKIITSPHHPLIKKAVRLRLEKGARDEFKQVLVSGKKLIADLSLFWPIEILFYTQNFDFSILASHSVFLSDSLLKKVSGLEHPDGVAAIAPLPRPSSLSPFRRILLLDGVRDPGNLGSLYRSALAFQWDAIGLLPHTVDPFNDKALRAAQGATFHLPYAYLTLSDAHRWVQETNAQLFIANLQGAPPETLDPSLPLALVLGNEGAGPSSKWTEKGISISIQMSSRIESLNVAVAGAILLYSLRSHL